MDVLTDLLARSRARGAVFSHTSVRGRSGVRFPPETGLALHAVVEGEAHLWLDDPGAATRLLPGDLVVVRGSAEHRLASDPGTSCVGLPDLLAAASPPGAPKMFALGPGEADLSAVFFCGAYLFDGDLATPLLEMLPDTIHLRPASGGVLRATVDLLARELPDERLGQQIVLDRLLDIALVHVLREYFSAHPARAPRWFSASADSGVGAALRALHADPHRPWSVAQLADVAALSRAAFARRFTALVGVAPLTYLTDWRMALAREQLRQTEDGLATVARAVGYESEFAFAAAFKRHHGTAPGRWRAGVRAGVADADSSASR